MTTPTAEVLRITRRELEEYSVPSLEKMLEQKGLLDDTSVLVRTDTVSGDIVFERKEKQCLLPKFLKRLFNITENS